MKAALAAARSAPESREPRCRDPPCRARDDAAPDEENQRQEPSVIGKGGHGEGPDDPITAMMPSSVPSVLDAIGQQPDRDLEEDVADGHDGQEIAGLGLGEADAGGIDRNIERPPASTAPKTKTAAVPSAR